MDNNIDLKLLRKFDSEITYSDVENDIFNNYKVVNIDRSDDDEYCYDFIDQLKNDYNLKIINYKAYIHKGINMRVLMELRKSCLIKFINDDEKYLVEFIDGHKKLKTQDKIRRFRVDFMREHFVSDYFDLDWQFRRLMQHMYGNRKADYIAFNYDLSCEDYTGEYIQNFEDMVEEFIFAQTHPRKEVIMKQIRGKSYLKGIVLDGIEL